MCNNSVFGLFFQANSPRVKVVSVQKGGRKTFNKSKYCRDLMWHDLWLNVIYIYIVMLFLLVCKIGNKWSFLAADTNHNGPISNLNLIIIPLLIKLLTTPTT